MELWGVIAEYNPFHNGHQYQLDWMKKQGATHIAVAMSGNFVQRGGPAVFSKWARAQAAVCCGADLVVELPPVCAMAPAADFALAGVWSLAQLGVSTLCFGSECGSLSLLAQAAQCCEGAERDSRFFSLLKSGMSYPSARAFLIRERYGPQMEQIASSPNDLLGIEYLRAMKQVAPKMKAAVLPRQGTGHNSSVPSGKFASASYLREQLLSGRMEIFSEYLPRQAWEIYQEQLAQQKAPCTGEKLDAVLIAKLRASSLEELARIRDVAEGLENRLAEAGRCCTGFASCEDFLSGKRYTRARVRRILWNVLLGIQKDQFPKIPSFLRLLALSQAGREILKGAGEAPVCQKPAALLKAGDPMMEQLALSTDLYSMCGPCILPGGRECTEPVFIQKQDSGR